MRKGAAAKATSKTRASIATPARPAQRRGKATARARAADLSAAHDHHRVYVVRLEDPRGKGRECFYVGMTGLDPDVRFDNHKRGYKSARVVKMFGIALAPEWYEDIPSMPYEEAALAEPTLADDLRDLGYIVYGPSNRKPLARRAPRKRGRAR
jgi:hypothetical protein